ncbi:MAG: zinc-binding dehydrogenase [Candidatus Promineifilaceae bacterium]|nr:zinc-binding dehydrogenase [Candidatus Promineifilaceae bacterium]
MRQIWLTSTGFAEVLELREVSDPTPRNGEVRIQVEAAGVSDIDLLPDEGASPGAVPQGPGIEVAGIVDRVAQGVSGLKEGDPVLAVTLGNGYADFVCVPEERVFKRLEWMGAVDGAALPSDYAGAYLMLAVMGSLRRQDTVLLYDLASPLGLAAVDICKLAGARVIGLDDQRHHEQLSQLGLLKLIDLRQRALESEVLRLTGGRGADLILNPHGTEDWVRNVHLLSAGGRLVSFRGRRSKWNFVDRVARFIRRQSLQRDSLIQGNRVVAGVDLRRLLADIPRLQQGMDRIIGWYDEALFRPRIAARFPLERAREAHQFARQRQALGKVVLVP